MAGALKVFPNVNSSIDVARNVIIRKRFIHIGVAVDTDHGLLVPVIRNADQKNVTEIAAELDELAQKARDRKLQPSEMEGGNFSISNLGGIGGTGFSPIVNWPEVAILGVSRGSMQPVWDGADLPTAPHAAAVTELRPPPGRRRRGSPIPALDGRGTRRAVAVGAGGVSS